MRGLDDHEHLLEVLCMANRVCFPAMLFISKSLLLLCFSIAPREGLSWIIASPHHGRNLPLAKRESTTRQFLWFASQEEKKDETEAAECGSVFRLAAREFHPENSKPSSKLYTPRKVEQESVWIDQEGVKGDYNHYRTIALSSTPDRAVSILTTDVMKLLRAYKFKVLDGDLGENILVDGVAYNFFAPGNRYSFTSTDSDEPVVLEITEPMIACANLCKLPCINDESRPLKDRVATCQEMISLLDKHSGQRGWYAKVVQGGQVKQNFSVIKVKS